jgi:Domain of unknown function (DUF4286)
MYPRKDVQINSEKWRSEIYLLAFQQTPYLCIMYLYNVTIGIDKEVEAEWVVYMREIHVPKVLSTGMFIDAKIYRILDESEEDTQSYSIQYFSPSIEQVQKYLEIHGPGLIEEHRERFQHKHVAFRTLLEEI